MDEEEYSENGVSLRSFVLPAILIAICNLLLLQPIRQLLDANSDQHDEKRFRYTAYFAINIFTYMFIAPLFLGTAFIPIFPSVVIACITGYYISKLLFPIEGEEKSSPIGNKNKAAFDEFLKSLCLDEENKLTLVDGRMIKNQAESSIPPSDIIHNFMANISAQDPNAARKLSQHYHNASSRDILYALVTCCDPILLQYVILKLCASGNAVPVLLPDCEDITNVKFLLWGLRKTTLCKFDIEAQLMHEVNVATFPVLTISAMRFGEIPVSKSDVLNKLMAASYACENRESFLSYTNNPLASVWSQGTVECDWFIPENSKESVNQVAGSLPAPWVNIPYALLNLRGDCRVFTKQVQLCINASNIVLLFTNSVGDDDLQNVIESATRSTHVILVLCSDGDISLKSTSSLTVVVAKDLDTRGVSHEILKIINANSADQRGLTIEEISQKCEELDIDVDEQHSVYQNAKLHATKSIGNPNAIQNFQKDSLFPLHALQKEWIKVDTEEIEGEDIESTIADKLERKEAIRSRQVNKELSNEFRNFLLAMNFERKERELFFAWLQILLNQINNKVLKPVQDELVSILKKRQEIWLLMNESESQCLSKDNERQLHNINSMEKEWRMKYDELKVGLDHYFSELGQAVECNYGLSDSYVDPSLLPEIMATSVLSSGISLEILDGDTCRSLLANWLGKVFSALDNTCQPHNTVRVVSVLGGPCTYKSTLLNSLFGVNFPVGVGKCSQGILVQLVPVHSSMKPILGCDCLVIIDSESLNTSGGKFADERSNYIVTFLSCISDVIIINLGTKTSQQEMQSVLEIISRGLVKTKEIKGSAKCCLVQHLANAGDSELDQNQKTLAIFKQVEEVMQRTAKVGGVEQKHAEMIDTFCSIDGSKNIKFVCSRYIGVSPLLNELHCKDIMNLRYYLLQLIANCGIPAMTYSEFHQCAVDITSALKTTNFVANFQNTNIENLKDDFTKHYREWVLSVQQELMIKLTETCNEVTNSNYESMDEKSVEVKKELTSIAQEKFKDLVKRLEEEIQSTKYKPIEDQLPFFQKDVGKYENEFLQAMETNLEKSVEKAKKFQNRDKRVENETEKFIQEFSKTVGAGFTHDDLLQTFQETQSSYVEKLKVKYPCWDFDTIHDRTKSNISYMLNQCGDKVEDLMNNKELSDFAMKGEQGLTMNDMHVLKDKFCVSEDHNETVFEVLRLDVENLCNQHPQFETNSIKAVKLFKKAEEKLHSAVESITLYLFLTSKFICGVHRSHLKEEVCLLAKLIQEDTIDTADGNTNTDHLWEMVESENYEIQDAEPLNFPNLESKLRYFLNQLEKSVSSASFLMLKEVLTIKNVNNCYPLPFTLIALQRLDRYFIALLPRMSTDDMKSIDVVVNDAKMTVISRAISKASLDFGGTFNDIYRMVQLSILDHDQKDEIQAAALVHLSAWSLDVFSIKRYDDEMENNVANSFKKMDKVFLAAYKTNINENCDELLAEIVCDEISQKLVDCIEDDMVHRLRETFLTKGNLFNVKRVFIGTILRDLCIADDYIGFVDFLQNFDEFSEKWILKFLARECNKGTGSLLQSIVQELIDAKVNATASAVDMTSSLFQKCESQKLRNWLSIFQQNMLSHSNVIIHEKDLEVLKTSTEVIDFHHFTNALINNLRNLNLKTSVVLPKAGSEDDTKIWLLTKGGGIHLELSKLIKGCTTQCPFCGAACEDTLREHDSHKTALHYPGGVKGWRDTVTDELYVKICTSAVASNARYRTPDTTFRPYKDYKVDYPDWDILAKDDHPMEFWKYVFTKFNKNFAKHYRCLKGKVPKEWMSYTKEQAIKSVEVAYKLSPL